MKILAIALAFLIPFAFAATCEQQAVEPLVTLECTDATATSLTAQGQVNRLESGSLVRRGFVFMEGTTGTPSFNAVPLVNPSFEEGDPPTGWHGHAEADGTIARSAGAEPVRVGSYSANITNVEGKVFNCRQIVPWDDDYQGTTVTFGAWLWSDIGDRVHLRIRDGVTSRDSDLHPGDGNWHWVTQTMTLDAGATELAVAVRIVSGSSISVYADGAFLAKNAIFEDGQFGTGSYSLDIKGLKPNTSYRVRAFVVDATGIRYGDTVTCQTLP